jgi:hypothetical protein
MLVVGGLCFGSSPPEAVVDGWEMEPGALAKPASQ